MAEPTISSSQGRQEKSDIVSRVKESATAQLTTQKDRGTDALGSVAQAVRSSTQKLREENHGAIAGYVERAADQIEDWSRRLREKDVDDLFTDVHRLARRQPAVFIGSAFALGLVGARFLKSSRQQNQYDDSSESRRQYLGGAPLSTAHDRGTRGHDEGAFSAKVPVADATADRARSTSEPSAETPTSRSSRGQKSSIRTERS
jgi:hypothetical protein